MPSNGPLNTPFASPLMSTPSGSDATTRGSGVTLNTDGGQGLTGTPFEKPCVSNPSQEPTANSSEIPNTWTTTGGIPNDPGAGSRVENAVTSPNTPSAGLVTGS